MQAELACKIDEEAQKKEISNFFPFFSGTHHCSLGYIWTEFRLHFMVIGSISD